LIPTVLSAPAKLNLCLYLGAPRSDGLHEIRSVFEPLELADRLNIEPLGVEERRPRTRSGGAAVDVVICPGVAGPNLAERALAALRERGWDAPPLRIEIAKRVPVAAGLGGGSADAAAVLRLALGEVEGIRELAAAVGADVPSQIQPRPCLVSGAGEVVQPVPPPGRHAVVLIPHEDGLATADVYAEADRLGLARSEAELDGMRRKLIDATAEGASPLDYTDMLVNDLEPAAISLRPEIESALAALTGAGAVRAMVTGSGPTAFGLFADLAAAERAADALREEHPGALATGPAIEAGE
jgi:4-diphosphocytidyl-2-C-methyl-D-erythritol kinase